MKLLVYQTIFAMCVLLLSDAFIIHYSEQHQNETRPVEQEGYISCTCDGQTQSRELPQNSLEQVFEGIRNHNICGRNYESPICDLIQKCQNCSAEIQQCKPVVNASAQYDCFKKRFVMRENHLINSFNDTTDSKDRVARHLPSCSYPANLKTADLICVKFPSSIKCKQKCIFGHTLKEGISRDMRCNYSENTWKPIGFEECRPFVDCTMTLVSTGKLDCVTGTTKMAPSCNVSCERYEDRPATPKRTYECRISGAWSIRLPYCATPGSGLDLAPAPRIKLHPLKN